jgi:hypothetical protein
MAAGEITPDEALVITKVLDGRLRALKARQLEDKLTAYDRIIPGDEVMLDEDEEEDLPPSCPSAGACGAMPDQAPSKAEETPIRTARYAPPTSPDSGAPPAFRLHPAGRPTRIGPRLAVRCA